MNWTRVRIYNKLFDELAELQLTQVKSSQNSFLLTQDYNIPVQKAAILPTETLLIHTEQNSGFNCLKLQEWRTAGGFKSNDGISKLSKQQSLKCSN